MPILFTHKLGSLDSQQQENRDIGKKLAETATALKDLGIYSALTTIHVHARRDLIWRYQYVKMIKLVMNAFLLLLQKPIEQSDNTLECMRQMEQAALQIESYKAQKMNALRETIEALILLNLQKTKYKVKDIRFVVRKIKKLGTDFINNTGIIAARNILENLLNLKANIDPNAANINDNNTTTLLAELALVPEPKFEQFILFPLNAIRKENLSALTDVIHRMLKQFSTPESKREEQNSIPKTNKFLSTVEAIITLYKKEPSHISVESIAFFFSEFWPLIRLEDIKLFMQQISIMVDLENKIAISLSKSIRSIDNINPGSAMGFLLNYDNYLAFIELLRNVIDSVIKAQTQPADLTNFDQWQSLIGKLDEYKKLILSIKNLVRGVIENPGLKYNTFIFYLKTWETTLDAQNVLEKNTAQEYSTLFSIQRNFSEELKKAISPEELFQQIWEKLQTFNTNIHQLALINQQLIIQKNSFFNTFEEFCRTYLWPNDQNTFWLDVVGAYMRSTLDLAKEKQKNVLDNCVFLFNLESQFVQTLNIILNHFQHQCHKTDMALESFLNAFRTIDILEKIFSSLIQRQTGHLIPAENKSIILPNNLPEQINLLHNKLLTWKSNLLIDLGSSLVTILNADEFKAMPLGSMIASWKNLFILQKIISNELSEIQTVMANIEEELTFVFQQEEISQNFPYMIDNILKTQLQKLTSISITTFLKQKNQLRHLITNSPDLQRLSKTLETLVELYIFHASIPEVQLEKGQIGIHPLEDYEQALQNELVRLINLNNSLKTYLYQNRTFPKRQKATNSNNPESKPDENTKPGLGKTFQN